jgi:hypothetical protein
VYSRFAPAAAALGAEPDWPPGVLPQAVNAAAQAAMTAQARKPLNPFPI